MFYFCEMLSPPGLWCFNCVMVDSLEMEFWDIIFTQSSRHKLESSQTRDFGRFSFFLHDAFHE
jgi:hypothetical protein